jgi:signal transduction histidine kinase/CheY-like chemotaxis protein
MSSHLGLDFLWLSLPLLLLAGMLIFIIVMRKKARAATRTMGSEIESLKAERQALQLLLSADRPLQDLCSASRIEGDRQKPDDQLRQTEQMVVQQERLRALGQMASGIAHDINNSLTPIIGYTDYLLEPDSILTDEARKCLTYVRTAAGDIAQMIEQVRQFYRRRDKGEQFSSVQLNSVVRDAIELTRRRWQDIPQKQGLLVNISTELDPELPDILGNRGELIEVLSNLLLNAVDALPGGGTITIATRLLPSNLEGSGLPVSQVVLEVRDTGVGMDELTRQRCLEPFFSTKGPRGNGLGLAMVYGIVRRHEGAIEIESEIGEGTVARLVFNVASDPEPEQIHPATIESNSLRILCIDDDRRIGAMLQEVLESQNHSVEIAEGGEQGIEAFRQARERGQPFHLIITDLGMPCVDGRQIVRIVKKESPETAVIMLTGWAAMMDQEGDLPREADAILTKPPSMQSLYETIAKVSLLRKEADCAPSAGKR